MAWSEWQDPFLIKVNPTFAWLKWDTLHLSGADTVHEVDYLPDPFGPGAKIGESTDWMQNQVVTNAVQFRVQDEWWSIRDPLPPPLEDKTRGQDYDLIPGRDEWADDAFVEYDPAMDSVWDGWGDDSGQHILELQGTGTRDSLGNEYPYRATGQVGLLFDSSFPEESGTQIDPSVPTVSAGGEWGAFDFVGSGVETITEDLYLDPFPAPGNMNAFTILVHATVTTDGASAGAYAAAYVQAFMPHQRVILPRWRYWIPDGVKPLRQRQRDDGLGLSTGRWRRGRSRQVSNRWKGYL